MPTKECPTCSRTFTTNANLKIHMNRKKPCLSPEEAALIPKKNYKFKCERCESTFQTNQNLMLHLNRKYPCVMKDPAPEEIELRLLFEQLKEEHLQQQQENKHLKVEIDHLKMQPITTNNNQNNHNNNIQNNITINVYGKEDVSHISDAMYKSCFNDFNQSVEKYWGMKHFSNNMQCNHNLYISNMRDGYMMVFNYKKWNIVDKEVTLKKMYYEAKECLSNAWDVLRNKNAIEPHVLTIYPKFIEDEIDDEREEKFKNASCNKMACMAYNNRKFPMQIKKQMDKRG